MSEQFSKKLFTLNLYVSNTLQKVLQNDPVGGELNPTQLGIFRHLYFHRDRSVYQRDLEKEFMLSRSTASRVLQGLESMDLLTRSGVEADGRLKQLILTPKALELGEKVAAFYRCADEKLLGGFSDEEMETMCRLLERMQENLKELIK